jgi:hypothetical protein
MLISIIFKRRIVFRIQMNTKEMGEREMENIRENYNI